MFSNCANIPGYRSWVLLNSPLISGPRPTASSGMAISSRWDLGDADFICHRLSCRKGDREIPIDREYINQYDRTRHQSRASIEQMFGAANRRSKTSPDNPRGAWIAFWNNSRKRIQTLGKRGLANAGLQPNPRRSGAGWVPGEGPLYPDAVTGKLP